MKIYIATPVNARSEATLEEKRKAAWKRVNTLRVLARNKYPRSEYHSSFDNDITPVEVTEFTYLPKESTIMGLCVQRVMECDAILMDWGYEQSKGCTIEHTTALTYGKKIIHAYDLGIEPENILDKYGIKPAKESQPTKEWQPAKSIDEAAEIVRSHPITEDMTYEERLAAQKARFGL